MDCLRDQRQICRVDLIVIARLNDALLVRCQCESSPLAMVQDLRRSLVIGTLNLLLDSPRKQEGNLSAEAERGAAIQVGC